MASIINAATSGGLISTADTSGVLALQTAGTTAVTVDASQNVGVGTASPAARLDVSTTSAAGVFTTTQTSGNAVTINVDAGSGTPAGLLVMAGIATIGSTAKLINVIDSAGGNLFNVQASGVAQFSAGTAALPALTTTGDTNTGIFFPAADTIAFSDGGAERARITSAGNFLIGNTTGTALLSVGANALAYSNQTTAITSGNTGYWAAGNSTGGSLSVQADYISSNGTGVLSSDSGTLNGIWFRLYGTSGYGYNFRINRDGNATNLNGSYGTISDARIKTVVGQATSQWNDIKQLNLVKYTLNKDTQFEASPENTEGFIAPVLMGLIAQELELICPGLVAESADPELGQIKTIKTSILYMKAVKALQEAMTRIEQLEARITALEGA